MKKIEAIRKFINSGDYSAPPGSVAFERELKAWCDAKGHVVQGFGTKIQDNDDFSSARNTRNLISQDKRLKVMNHKQKWFDDPNYDDVLDGPYNPFKALMYDAGGGAFGAGKKQRRGGKAGSRGRGKGSRRGSGGYDEEGTGRSVPQLSGSTVGIVVCAAAVVYFLRNQLMGLLGSLLPILVLAALILGAVKIIPRLIRGEIQFSFIFISLILFVVGFNGHLAGIPPLARAGCIIVALLLLAFG